MTEYYKRIVTGTAPVDLTTMKSYMKVTSTADDVLIQALIDTCTEYAEKYTAREARVNTWELLIDIFCNPIRLCRNPIASITSVEHLVSDVFVAVTATDYYKKDLVQRSEIHLVADKSWPTNTDDRQQAIKITFVTEAHACILTTIEGIKRHVLWLHTNRGDCYDSDESGKLSGADSIFNTIRIPRV